MFNAAAYNSAEWNGSVAPPRAPLGLTGFASDGSQRGPDPGWTIGRPRGPARSTGDRRRVDPDRSAGTPRCPPLPRRPPVGSGTAVPASGNHY